MGWAFVLVAVFLLVAAAAEIYSDWQFALHAHSTQGTILSKKITRTGSRGRGTWLYEAKYRFELLGASFVGTDHLAKSAGDQLAPGKPAEILYLPDDFASNRLAGTRAWETKTVRALFGILCVIFGIAFVREDRQRTTADV